MDNIKAIALAKFDGIEAHYWGEEDEERLSCTEPLEALELIVDKQAPRMGCGSKELEEAVRNTCTFQVYPYARKAIGKEAIKDYADELMDHLQERLDEDEDWSDPEGDSELMPAAVRERFEPAMLELVTRILGEIEPWQCERGKPVQLTADEVIALLPETFAE